MKVRLVVVSGELSGRVIELEDPQAISFGRALHNDVVLNDLGISRVHCRIENTSGQCTAQDLGSRNGTFVNQQRVEVQSLRPGDEIRVGGCVFKVDFAGAEAPAGATEATAVELRTDPTSETDARLSPAQPPELDPEVAATTAWLSTHPFCSACGKIVTRKDITDGKAQRLEGRILCTGCLSPLIGKVIGQYRIVQRLASGNTGQVFRAEHLTVGKQVAIKILHERLTWKKSSVQKFLREARSGASINHPHLVQIYDAGEQQGLHYIVMELVEGKRLDQVVNEQGPLGPKQALHIGVQVSRALHYLHQKKIIHRDMRPANIMVTRDYVAKIIDLGTAKWLEDSGMLTFSQSGMNFADVNYIAPEQAFEPSKVDFRTDIYALGATLYFLLTGNPPYQCRSFSDFITKLRGEDPPALKTLKPSLPDELCHFVHKMMNKTRDERFASTEQMTSEMSTYFFQAFSGEYLTDDAMPSEEAGVTPEIRAVRSDIRLARDVQRKLVPSELPVIPDYQMSMFYRPAKAIGGDYLDIFPIGNNRYAVIIGDVSGKGVSGAMVMVMVRSVFRMVGAQKSAPRQTILDANAIITRDIRRGMFVSMIYATLDTNTHMLSLVNAGHNPPLVWKSSQGRAEFLKLKGMALGITDGANFEKQIRENEVNLERDDRLILYTDGVTEARNEAEKDFGTEALSKVVTEHPRASSEELLQKIVSELERFRGNAAQTDDITLIAFTYQPSLAGAKRR